MKIEMSKMGGRDNENEKREEDTKIVPMSPHMQVLCYRLLKDT